MQELQTSTTLMGMFVTNLATSPCAIHHIAASRRGNHPSFSFGIET